MRARVILYTLSFQTFSRICPSLLLTGNVLPRYALVLLVKYHVKTSLAHLKLTAFLSIKRFGSLPFLLQLVPLFASRLFQLCTWRDEVVYFGDNFSVILQISPHEIPTSTAQCNCCLIILFSYQRR